MKVVINVCHGGFGLSHKAVMRYAELAGTKLYTMVEGRKKDGSINWGHYEYFEGSGYFDHSPVCYFTQPLRPDGKVEWESFWSERNIERNNPFLIQVVEELGEVANDGCAKLKIVEIPDGIEWDIEEYDGKEWVAEKHRTWS